MLTLSVLGAQLWRTVWFEPHGAQPVSSALLASCAANGSLHGFIHLNSWWLCQEESCLYNRTLNILGHHVGRGAPYSQLRSCSFALNSFAPLPAFRSPCTLNPILESEGPAALGRPFDFFFASDFSRQLPVVERMQTMNCVCLCGNTSSDQPVQRVGTALHNDVASGIRIMHLESVCH